jgi:hypothetical protein
MSQMGFEPTIQVFERAKTVHALELAATAIGSPANTEEKIIAENKFQYRELV